MQREQQAIHFKGKTIIKSSSITTWGITVSKASGSNISTYGVGYSKTIGAKGTSIGKLLFGTAKGASYYWALPINRNAKELYSLVESKV